MYSKSPLCQRPICLDEAKAVNGLWERIERIERMMPTLPIKSVPHPLNRLPKSVDSRS